MIGRVCLFILIFSVSAGCGKTERPEWKNSAPERIISLAPNITETVCALGLGGKLAGVTTSCIYPEFVKKLPKVGGFGLFNFEAIVALKPDLVILQEEDEAGQERLTRLGIPFLAAGSRFIGDILEAIRVIGAVCGAREKAEELARGLEARMERISRRPPAENLLGVLAVFAVDNGEYAKRVYAFTSSCLHGELLKIAGAKNVVKSLLPYAMLSKEAILRLNPDIIIELAPGKKPLRDPVDAWRQYPSVNAVKTGCIHRLSGSYVCLPGPRFIKILEDFSAIIGEENE